jgi:hypothetical protein
MKKQTDVFEQVIFWRGHTSSYTSQRRHANAEQAMLFSIVGKAYKTDTIK